MSSVARPGLVVLVSGNGSNLQAIIDACAEGRLRAEVAAVVSNNSEAFALKRAEAAGIPTVVAPFDHVAATTGGGGAGGGHVGATTRIAYDTELAGTVSSLGADLVVLAGWNHLLSSHFLAHHTTINLHPAKPGTFAGLHAIEKAFAAWQETRIDHGGVMVHYVPDEGVDNGPVIAWEQVPFEPGDTLEDYESRVHGVEHRLLVEAIATVLATQR